MPRYNLTALRLYIGALDCSVPSPVRYSQARTFSTIITTIQMKENIVNTSTSPKETRSVFVGAKVTPSQRDRIKSLAEQCGMTVSDYLLARAYGYTPRARLSRKEATLLQELDGCRSDLVRYTSALQGMSTSQRLTLFNHIPFMADWFHKLRPITEAVSDFLTAVREQNRVPSPQKPKEEK